jgi:hypothetical protein
MKKTTDGQDLGGDLLPEDDFQRLRVVAHGPGRKIPETWPEAFWTVFGEMPEDFERPPQIRQEQKDRLP